MFARVSPPSVVCSESKYLNDWLLNLPIVQVFAFIRREGNDCYGLGKVLELCIFVEPSQSQTKNKMTQEVLEKRGPVC